MSTLCKMFRTVLLPLLLFTLSMACMGQTFQYSRGWTNGKRASAAIDAHLHREEDNLSDIFELQDGGRKLERCILQLQHFVRNPLILRSTSLSPNQNNNNLFGNHHHQSNELFDELNPVEANDYAKH